MRILALDLATVVGWCVDGPTVCPPTAGAFRLRGGGAELGIAGFSFGEWLCDAIAVHKPGAVVVEAPLMGGPGVISNAKTSRLLIGLAFLAETTCAGLGVRSLEEHVQTVRAHFLGHGRPAKPKEATIARCRLLGWDIADHNAADAAALWAFSKAKLDKTFRLEAATPLFGRPAAAAGVGDGGPAPGA